MSENQGFKTTQDSSTNQGFNFNSNSLPQSSQLPQPGSFIFLPQMAQPTSSFFPPSSTKKPEAQFQVHLQRVKKSNFCGIDRQTIIKVFHESYEKALNQFLELYATTKDNDSVERLNSEEKYVITLNQGDNPIFLSREITCQKNMQE